MLDLEFVNVLKTYMIGRGHFVIFCIIFVFLILGIRSGTTRNFLRMWFMIPTPPYVVDGVERGSARNRRFALRSDQEVREYLRCGHMREVINFAEKGKYIKVTHAIDGEVV